MKIRGIDKKILGGVTMVGITLMFWGCANKCTSRQQSPQNISITSMGTTLVFFDNATGKLWAYGDPEKPAELIGQMKSFDQPLITASFKAAQEKKVEPAKLPPQVPVQPQVVKAPEGRTLADQFNALPKNFWPTDDENQIKRDARDTWLKENVKPGMGTFTGKLSSVSKTPDGTKVQAILHVENIPIWGHPIMFYVTATFDGLTPTDVIDWKTGQMMTVTGIVKAAIPHAGMFSSSYSLIEVTLENAAVKR